MLIFVVVTIVSGIAVTLLRKRYNWRLSVHWVTPLGLPSVVAIAITIYSLNASRDDSQFAFGLAASIIVSVPFAVLYGITSWVAERLLNKEAHQQKIANQEDTPAKNRR